MKNSDTKENYDQDDQNFQNPDKGTKANQKASSTSAHRFTDNAEPDYAADLSLEQNTSPYDSENLDQESESDSKDITEKDIEKDLIENDPSQGFETDIDTEKSDEGESDTFETIEAEENNPVKKEFEIGELGNGELREDELTRDETGGARGNIKPSERKF